MTVLLAPMRAEARALRRRTTATVLRTGTGPARSAHCASRLAGRTVLVAGVGGGLSGSLRTGDVVVADRVYGPDPDSGPVRLPGAEALADRLRRTGATVHIGTIASRPRIVAGAQRDRLARTGALVADTESYWLLAGPARPAGCVRVVADCVPGPVFGPATLWHLGTALRRLALLAAELTDWAAPGDPVCANESRQPLEEVR